MEAGASAPRAGHIEPEPPEWQPRVIWVAGRLLCGTISFFFAAFVFAYFYLRTLNTNHSWVIPPVHPAQGLGLSIMALYVVGAIIYRLAARRTEVDELGGAAVAVGFTLAAVALQFLEYTVLDFGASNGGYASVFFGWTTAYAVVALMGAFWIWTQAASIWRIRREGKARAIEVPTSEAALLRAGLESSSFYWAYFAAIGFLAYILLYAVGT